MNIDVKPPRLVDPIPWTIGFPYCQLKFRTYPNCRYQNTNVWMLFWNLDCFGIWLKNQTSSIFLYFSLGSISENPIFGEDFHESGPPIFKQQVVADFVQALSMPRGTDERFLQLAFQD